VSFGWLTDKKLDLKSCCNISLLLDIRGCDRDQDRAQGRRLGSKLRIDSMIEGVTTQNLTSRDDT